MIPEKTGIIRKQRIIFFEKGNTFDEQSQRDLKQDGIQKTRIGFYEKGKMKDTESTVEIKIQS